MKRNKVIAVFVVALVLCLLAGVALAQNGYNLVRWSIGGGGGASAGDDYTLSGAVEQAEAGGAQGGSYGLAGGFWGGAAPAELSEKVYLPLTSR